MDEYNEELYHHGILGMKWYQRRYQNSDGTLTDAGKKRYNKYHNKDGSINKKVIKPIQNGRLKIMIR